MKAEIISVGTELLLGQIVNMNTTFLSKELTALGMNIYYQSVVGDNSIRLEKLLSLAEERSDLIVLCGGLGPTGDDLTKQVVAKHLSQQLITDHEGYQKLLKFCKSRDIPLTESDLRQVLVFEDGRALQNPVGSAVGIFFENNNKSYLLLPGPPAELKDMYYKEAVPLLEKKFQQKDYLISRVLRFYGVGESKLVIKIKDLIDHQTNPTIASYAKKNEVTLRLTIKTSNKVEGNKILDRLDEEIQRRAGEFFYGYGDNNSLAQVVIELLKQKNKTLSIVEEITAGNFQGSMGQFPDFSMIFSGGVVLNSDRNGNSLLSKFTGYSGNMRENDKIYAENAARRIRNLTNSDLGLSIIESFDPNILNNDLNSSVCIVIADESKVESFYYRFAKDNDFFQQSIVMKVLDVLRRKLIGSYM